MSFISLYILKARLFLLCQVPLFPLAVHCCIFFIFFVSNNQILHFFSIHSHCISAINKHKGKWVVVLTNKTTLFFITLSTVCSTECYTLLLSDPNSTSRNLVGIYFRFIRVTYWSSIILARCHKLISLKKIHISSKGKSNTSVISSLLFRFFVWWHKYFITWFYIHTFWCIYI